MGGVPPPSVAFHSGPSKALVAHGQGLGSRVQVNVRCQASGPSAATWPTRSDTL